MAHSTQERHIVKCSLTLTGHDGDDEGGHDIASEDRQEDEVEHRHPTIPQGLPAGLCGCLDFVIPPIVVVVSVTPIPDEMKAKHAPECQCGNYRSVLLAGAALLMSDRRGSTLGRDG